MSISRIATLSFNTLDKKVKNVVIKDIVEPDDALTDKMSAIMDHILLNDLIDPMFSTKNAITYSTETTDFVDVK